MAKVWVISDLHMPIADERTWTAMFGPLPEADLCIIAGDVSDDLASGLQWIGENIAGYIPTVMVLGNHDHFGWDIPKIKRDATLMAGRHGVVLLDDSETIISGIRIVGSCLWTDYRIFDSLPNPSGFTPSACMAHSKKLLADFDEIYATEPSEQGQMARLLKPMDTVGFHKAAREFIRSRLADAYSGITVVVTHYAPSPRSIHIGYLEDMTTAAFASDLEEVILEGQPSLWVHGHVHKSFDYVIGGTRVVCNPRGYADSPNSDFNPGFVLDIAAV